MTTQTDYKMIHLLYVPTLVCNMNCSYCYLNTEVRKTSEDRSLILPTLRHTLTKFLESGIMPFNISLHGGEVTTLDPSTLEELFIFIRNYYQEHKDFLEKKGFFKATPHIKTNLLNFDEHYDLFDKYELSVSASIDLPLENQSKYRKTKSGADSGEIILKNLKLLAKYPHKKKFSSVIYYDHYKKVDKIIEDIWSIHNNIGFDMNHFNFMIGFDSNTSFYRENPELRVLKDEEQADFFKIIYNEFKNTKLKEGLDKKWFEEFTPAFCSASTNCGEKFFLLQSDGDIFSCVRGQGDELFKYGNIYNNSVQEIIANGYSKINFLHNSHLLDNECKTCDYLSHCRTGCPFVKHKHHSSKSYTCALQKEIYKTYSNIYPPDSEDKKEIFLKKYISENHPHLAKEEKQNKPYFLVPNEVREEKNFLDFIISEDPILKECYSKEKIILTINDFSYNLESQILKKEKQIIFLNSSSSISLKIDKILFDLNCVDKFKNTLYIMVLRDTKVVYGDEKRMKQEHIFTHQIFYNILSELDKNNSDFFEIDISDLIKLYSPLYLKNVLNNFFVTTSCIRDYHYQKQKENAFYHIQAINLPFQNIEFYFV